MMDKQTEVNKRMAIAQALLGKTTGASKGRPAPQPGKVRIKPLGGFSPHGVSATWTKKF